MTLQISVVIPTYRRSARIPALLEALARQTMPPESFEVIMVDNCSDDDTSSVIHGHVGQVPYRLRPLRTEVNRGPAAARNLGWRAATTSFVAFLDDDCTPDPTWLEAGLAALRSQDTLGLVQGKVGPPERIDAKDYGDHFVWRVIDEPSPYFEACNIFYRKKALEMTGGFDENLGWWGEDTAAGWRVIAAGWDRSFVPDAVVIHPVDQRGWRWHMQTGLLDTHIVGLATEHPGFRAEAFWRSWSYRREDAAFVAALIGLAGATRWRPAALAILPYCWWRRPSIRRPAFVRLCVQLPLIDLARLAGQVRGAVRYRTLVL